MARFNKAKPIIIHDYTYDLYMELKVFIILNKPTGYTMVPHKQTNDGNEYTITFTSSQLKHKLIHFDVFEFKTQLLNKSQAQLLKFMIEGTLYTKEK